MERIESGQEQQWNEFRSKSVVLYYPASGALTLDQRVRLLRERVSRGSWLFCRTPAIFEGTGLLSRLASSQA